MISRFCQGHTDDTVLFVLYLYLKSEMISFLVLVILVFSFNENEVDYASINEKYRNLIRIVKICNRSVHDTGHIYMSC